MKRASTTSRLLLGLLLALASCLDQPRSPRSCNDLGKDAVITAAVPGNPFQALPSPDGCWLFVSVTRAAGDGHAAIALYRRFGGAVTLERMLPLEGAPAGMALADKGRVLVVAAGDRVAFVETGKLIAGTDEAVLAYLDDPTALGRVYAGASADESLLFVADEHSSTISVIDFAKARASRFSRDSTIGKIPTGTAPIAVTVSPDNKYMFATSQWAPASYHWPIECEREGRDALTDTTAVNPQGAIHIIDVEKARTDPASSIIRSVPAGCSPVRLALSPPGDRAFVTARNSNALLVFDVARLRYDSAGALVGRVPAGTSPVGVAVVGGGKRVIVTSSNRFGGAGQRGSLTVIDPRKNGADAVVGSIEAGTFPRELSVTQDGRTLVLTNFGSQTIQLIDLARLPLRP